MSKSTTGFTLIEILIVIAIMAILTVIAYSSFGGARINSSDNQKVADINVIQLSLQEYFNQYHQYPTTLSDALLLPLLPTSMNTAPYNYFPMTKVSSNSTICTSYQLSVLLQANNSYLQSKKGFDSTNLPSGTYDCGGGHVGVNASLTNPNGTLIYDAMPQ